MNKKCRSYILDNMVRKFLPKHPKCFDYEGRISKALDILTWNSAFLLLYDAKREDFGLFLLVDG